MKDDQMQQQKKKAKGGTKQQVSASSFLSLKADLAELRSSGSSSASLDSLRKPERKLPAHLRPSPQVLARRYAAGEGLVDGPSNDELARERASSKGKSKSTTSSWAHTPLADLERSRAALERKVEMYEKLRKGKHGGLDKQMLEGGVIDWDRKALDQRSASGSDDEDSSQEEGGAGTKVSLEDDPIIDYVDDFGRTRSARRSDVPRHLLPEERKEAEPPDESLVHYGPSIAFPIYRPPSPQLAAKQAAILQEPTVDRFDATKEVRNRGAAFYRFSKDEQERQRQMEELKDERKETVRTREEKGLVDEEDLVEEGEAGRKCGPAIPHDPFAAVEASSAGIVPPSTSAAAPQPIMTATQKRIAERKVEVEAKRRKLLGDKEFEARKKELEEKRLEAFLDNAIVQGGKGS